jgi:hypothetical protein
MSRTQKHWWIVPVVALAMANADESARAAGQDDKAAGGVNASQITAITALAEAAPRDASQAAAPAQRPLAQDATQPDTDFPIWFLKSTRLIDPRLRPSAGIRVPRVSPREGGPLLFPNFPENDPGFVGGQTMPWSIRGSLGLFSVDRERDSSRFQEYRDVRDGTTAGLEAHFRDNRSVFNLLGRQLGRRDQDLTMDGALVGKFLWSAFYDETPHTYAFGAKSLYTGLGTNVLSIADSIQLDLQNSTTLPQATAKLTDYFNQQGQSFDASLRRQKTGVDVTLLSAYPFALKAGFSNESRDGTQLASASFAFYDFSEIPFPVKYDTRELKVTAERARPESRLYWSATYRASDFIDRFQTLTFDNPLRAVDSLGTYTTTFQRGPATGALALPPSNTYQEGSTSVVIKDLPLRSTLNALVSAGYLRQDEALMPFSTNSAVTLSSTTNPSFNATDLAGLPRRTAKTAMNTDTVHVRWTGTLTPKVHFNQQYRLYKLTNHEQPFEMLMFVREDQDPRFPETAGASYRTVLADFTKHTSTSEISYDAPADTHLSATYTFERMNRSFREVAWMNDNKAKVAVDTRRFGMLDLKSWYEFTNRTAAPYDNNQYNDVQGNPVGRPILPLLRKFDEAAYHKHEWQGMVTAYVNDATSVSGHVELVGTNYTDSPFGVLWDRRHAYGVDVTYAPSARWNVFADAGLERVQYEQGARSWRAPSPASAAAPFAPEPGFDSFSNWTALATDIYSSAGLGFEFFIVPEKLRLNMQYTYARSDGQEEFTSPLGTSAADDTNLFVPLPFTDVDDTVWHTFNPEIEYTLSKQVSLSAGWHYEKWRSADYTTDGFVNVNNYQTFFPFSTNANGLAMETGGFLPPPYRVNVLYVRMKVGF